MIKIHANVSKKVPVPGVQFSSQSFMAGIEIEVSDGATAEQIQGRIKEVYGLLENTIDAEIAAQGASDTPEPKGLGGNGGNGGQRRWNNPRSNGNGHKNGNGRHASQAQIKAIFAISHSIGLERDQLLDYINTEFGVATPDELTIKQASTVIENLKQEEPKS